MVDTTKNIKVYTTYGTKSAKPVQPKISAKLISKAKRPLFVVSSAVLDEEILKRAISIAKKTDMQIARNALLYTRR